MTDKVYKAKINVMFDDDPRTLSKRMRVRMRYRGTTRTLTHYFPMHSSIHEEGVAVRAFIDDSILKFRSAKQRIDEEKEESRVEVDKWYEPLDQDLDAIKALEKPLEKFPVYDTDLWTKRYKEIERRIKSDLPKLEKYYGKTSF